MGTRNTQRRTDYAIKASKRMKIFPYRMVNKKEMALAFREENDPFHEEPEGNNGTGADQGKYGQRFDSKRDGKHPWVRYLDELCYRSVSGANCCLHNHPHRRDDCCFRRRIQRQVPPQQARCDQRIRYIKPVVVCPYFRCFLGPMVPLSVIHQPNTLGSHYPDIGNRHLFRAGVSFVVQRYKLGQQKSRGC